jgi:predicted glycoside hydrolase/deacetylase ChbG (UPF0249 family)
MKIEAILKYLLTVLLLQVQLHNSSSQTLAEKLGYMSADKLLIINCDDVGMCHSSNLAVIDGMENGVITSGTIMTPCPWFNEIAEYARKNPEKDFGVHLTHTAEWKNYRWGPVSRSESAKSLIDKEGYLWKSIEEVYANSAPAAAKEEARAQIRKALDAGIPVTHIDSHMGTLQYNPEYLIVYGQLAVEFNLPLRMAGQPTMEKYGFPGFRKQFSDMGLVFPDHFIHEELNDYKDVRTFWINIIKNLQPGVTELYIHASRESDELKAITNSWKTRVMEAQTFTSDSGIKQLIKDQKIILIGYRQLMQLQRKNSPSAKP